MADDDGIADECIHLMTTAFCSICKAQSRQVERKRRRIRNQNGEAWSTEMTLPYPHTTAQWSTLCPHCDEYVQPPDEIFLVEGMWVDRACAEDCLTLGVQP